MPYDWLGHYDENYYPNTLACHQRDQERRVAGETPMEAAVRRRAESALAEARLRGQAAYAAADAASEIPLD